MPLSNSLVSKFVKATKNDTSKKKEKTVYGKIVTKEEDGKPVYYAKIDGADDNMLVPISHFTSNVNDNDKVVIMIKDHLAIVTGNVTKPSADSDQVGTIVDEKFSQLEIESIDIDHIKSLWE